MTRRGTFNAVFVALIQSPFELAVRRRFPSGEGLHRRPEDAAAPENEERRRIRVSSDLKPRMARRSVI